MKEKVFTIIVLVILVVSISGCINNSSSQTKTRLSESNGCPSGYPLEYSSEGKMMIPGVMEWAAFEQCGKDIPLKYQEVQYCETDSDCVQQATGCEPISLNKYNAVDDYVKKVGDATGYYPHCYVQELSPEFLTPYCDLNVCKLRTDCSNCKAINEFLESIGCFQEKHSIVVQKACDQLAECNC